MSSSSTLPLSRDAADPTRIVLISGDLPRVASYYKSLEAQGFQVLLAFDINTALDICHRSTQPVKAAVILTEPGPGSSSCEGDLVRSLAASLPTVPCILLPPESSGPDCAVLIRTAMRCTAAAYLGSS